MLAGLLDWLATAPPGTLLDAAAVRELLLAGDGTVAEQPVQHVSLRDPTWRERLWTVPPETRIGVSELAEALGRPKSWVYRRTAPSGDRAPLPHRKLDGELVFVVGEVRVWLPEHETVIAPSLRLPRPRSGSP